MKCLHTPNTEKVLTAKTDQELLQLNYKRQTNKSEQNEHFTKANI